MKSSKSTSGLEEQEKKDLEDSLRAATIAFRRLKVLLEKKRESNNTSRISKTAFELPAWDCYQADSNGYERAINEVLKLIEVDHG